MFLPFLYAFDTFEAVSSTWMCNACLMLMCAKFLLMLLLLVLLVNCKIARTTKQTTRNVCANKTPANKWFFYDYVPFPWRVIVMNVLCCMCDCSLRLPPLLVLFEYFSVLFYFLRHINIIQSRRSLRLSKHTIASCAWACANANNPFNWL